MNENPVNELKAAGPQPLGAERVSMRTTIYWVFLKLMLITLAVVCMNLRVMIDVGHIGSDLINRGLRKVYIYELKISVDVLIIEFGQNSDVDFGWVGGGDSNRRP